MISTRWLEKRKPYWSKLEALLNQSDQRRPEVPFALRPAGTEPALPPDRGRSRGHPRRPGFGALCALRQPTARARSQYHLFRPQSESPGGMSFFWDTYPAAFRRNLKHCLLATVVSPSPDLVGAVLTYQNPDFKVKLLGPQMVETIDRHQMWTHSIVGIKPVASSAIMTNNMSVGFTTFALGITGGLGTHVHDGLQRPDDRRDRHGLLAFRA